MLPGPVDELNRIVFGGALFGGIAVLGLALRWFWWSGNAAPVRRGALSPPDMLLAAARPAEIPPAERAAPVPAASGEPRNNVNTTQAGRDVLTGLPSQVGFAARLQNAVQQAHAGGACRSVLLIGLEGRQGMIRQHGKKAGDRALCAIARRLQAMLKESETLARLGPDAFAVIAEGHSELETHRNSASRLAKRMMTSLRQPVAANDTGLYFAANIGIALCRPGCASGSGLMHSAAAALQRAKARATGFGLGDEWEEGEAAQDPMEQALRRAIAAGEIIPFYQPVIDLKADRISGFEALARWRHPTRGFIRPDIFIPMVEKIDMMPALTTMMLRQICVDIRQWPADLRVAFNVSPSELSDADLPERILQIARAEGIAGERLGIEITEIAVVRDNTVAQANLLAFRQAGIMTALDDFGTGYASLTQLRQLQVDYLKIDRSFVQPLLNNNDCDAIVSAVLGLARNLNLRVVAEGIESAAIAAALVTRGCEFGQGYYFAEPMTAGDATAMLQTGRRWLNAA